MSRILSNVAVPGAGAFQGGQLVSGIVRYRDMHPEAALKELRPAIKQANFETLRFWHRRFLPGHFEPAARDRYGYEPRTKQYRKRKARFRGHQKPLVWSGQGSRNAIRQIKPKGTSKSARGLMPGTQVFNFGRRRNMPPMREEVVRTTRGQRRAMARAHERTVAQHLRAIRGTTEKRV